jgi:hypothetical protein
VRYPTLEKPREKPRSISDAASGDARTLRSDDLEAREIRAVARGIADEQDQAGDRGVGADVEFRQRSFAAAASSPVSDEALPGEEGRVGWMFVFTAAVYNLVRLRNLAEAPT